MAILMRHKSTIFGLTDDLDQLNQDIINEALAREAADGDLTELQTTEKTSLVGAINEVLAASNSTGDSSLQKAENLADLTDVEVARTNLGVKSAVDTTAEIVDGDNALQDQIDGIDAATLKKSENLSDLTDVEVARTNLGVSSTEEMEAAIEAAKLALGTNFTVNTLAERDAMTDLDDGDRVLVRDGDGVADSGNWVLFKPTNIVDGVPGDWMMLSSKSSFEGSTSAEAIKQAYESNLDTNAFTDAEKALLATIEEGAQVNTVDTVNGLTGDVVLGAAEIERGVSTVDADLTALETETARLETDKADIAYVDSEVAAARTYAEEVALAGGSVPLLESVTVVGSEITLTHAPRDGISGVMNFGTVRKYDQATGTAYDAPVAATADPKVFTVSTDTANQWDTNVVQVQYMYTVDPANG